MVSNDAILKLKYAFSPNPMPIRASVSGADPYQVEMTVMISNPEAFPLTLDKITITIPVGEQTARSLSSEPNLPEPVYEQSDVWKIVDSGSRITIEPKTGVKAEITDSIEFTLPGIRVNCTAGIVPITVVEYPPDEPKRIDRHTYELTKQPADFPVTEFYSDPAVITKPEEETTLFWKCSEQGKKYTYQVHSDSWRPTEKYTWKDGTSGVATPVLIESTVLALDIMEADPQGHLKIRDTLYTTVEQRIPRIVYSEQTPTLSGRLVNLRWIATDAAKCVVSLDTGIVDDNAPTNTYSSGYCAAPPNSGPHQYTVKALDKTGTIQTEQGFPMFDTTPVTFPTGKAAMGVAITPDDTMGIVVNGSGGGGLSGTATLIDMQSRTPIKTVPAGIMPFFVSVTSDSRYAVVTGFINLAVIDLKNPDNTTAINTGQNSSFGVLTPNGQYGLLPNEKSNQVAVFHIGKSEVVANIPVGNAPKIAAITPDGTTALISNSGSNNVSVVDIAGRKVIASVPVGTGPTMVSITPDGKFGFVANNQSSTVSVIDIHSRKTVATIPTGPQPMCMTITNDSSLAFVGCKGVGVFIDVKSLKAESKTVMLDQEENHFSAVTPDDVGILVVNSIDNNVCVIDVAKRKIVSSIPVGKGPFDLAIMNNGNHGLVSSMSDGSCTII